MKILTVSILKSIPLLFDIFLLLVLFLFLFALVGTQIYGGLFSQQCYAMDGIPTGQLCYLDPKCAKYQVNCGNSGCDENQYCWNSGTNPNQGGTSFDNIPASLCTVFVGITLKGWSDVMRMGRAVVNQKFLNDIYFYLLIAIGSFFLIKLTVAAIYLKFEMTLGEQHKQIILITNKKIKKNWAPKPPENPCKQYARNWYDARLFMYKLTNTAIFNVIIMTIIIVNTGVMASEYYGMSSTHQNINENVNLALNVCFCIEMVMKLIGLGFRGYLDEAFNIFDGTLVILGMVEIILASKAAGLKGLIVFRAFRLLRIFRLARRWKKLRNLLGKLLNAVKSIAYLGLLTLIFMFIFTLLGKQLFKGKLLDDKGEIPRANFETLFWSFVTVFEILTGEGWNELMYNAVGNNGWGYCFYFIVLIVLGSYILLNLFIAILVSQFENENEAEETLESIDSEDSDESSGFRKPSEVSKRQRRKEKLRENLDKPNKNELSGRSYYCFGSDSKFRLLLSKCMLHPYFDSTIYTVISLSCIILALDEPKVSPTTSTFLSIISLIVLIMFTLEFIIKSVVLGLFKGENSYMKNSWNVLDLMIILVSYTDLILVNFGGNSVNLSFLRAFRALRALRPLRMVSHNERMKKVVVSVIQAVPAVLNVMLITLLFYLIFGILGVIFFKGVMYYCTDSNIIWQNECYGNFIDSSGRVIIREWRTLSYNFDNIFNAMLTLFDVSTLEKWPLYLDATVDGVGEHRARIRDYNPAAALFYIFYIFVSDFFIMNLYLGTVVKKFNEIQKELDGSEFLSASQKEWIRVQKLLFLVQPQTRYLKPTSKIRLLFYNIIMNYKFDLTIQTIIILNVAFMSLYSYPIDKELNNLLDYFNYIFILIFSLEVVLKNIGLGARNYFSDNWNRFDFLVTILSVVTLQTNFGINNATMLRAFRILRTLRVIKVFKGFQFVFNTLVLSAPSLINVGMLLLLLWFVYGIAGMYLFGNLDLTVTQILDENQNFATFYNSVSLLFQCITGENWNLIMRDCMGNYDCTGGYDICGNPTIAVIFWVSYTILGQYFFLNMFIAVILENFIEEPEDLIDAGITDKDLKKYQKAWRHFAPYAQSYISVFDLPDLLVKIDAPLGFKGQNLSSAQMLSIINALHIEEHNGYVDFTEVLWKLTSAVSGADLSNAPYCEAIKTISKQLPGALKSFSKNKNISEQEKSPASKKIAAKVILKAWRESKGKQGLKSAAYQKFRAIL